MQGTIAKSIFFLSKKEDLTAPPQKILFIRGTIGKSGFHLYAIDIRSNF
jgi:hypothetical protein